MCGHREGWGDGLLILIQLIKHKSKGSWFPFLVNVKEDRENNRGQYVNIMTSRVAEFTTNNLTINIMIFTIIDLLIGYALFF